MQDLNNKINDGGATAAGQLSSDEWNQIPSEIQNAIISSGQALSGGDLSQLVKAIAQYGSVGTFFTGAGIADAYTANAVTPAIAPPALKNGMIVRFIVSATNTGASTLNAFTLGLVDIKLPGGIADPLAGSMSAGKEIELIYRLTPNPHWEIKIVEPGAVEAGTIIDFGGTIVPSGYLICDGSEVDQTTYSDLFAAIGSTWNITGEVGGPTIGNFRLPPSEIGGLGLFKRGVGANPVGTYKEDAIKSHTHSITTTGNVSGGVDVPNSNLTTLDYVAIVSGTFQETKPVSITTLMCIKY